MLSPECDGVIRRAVTLLDIPDAALRFLDRVAEGSRAVRIEVVVHRRELEQAAGGVDRALGVDRAFRFLRHNEAQTLLPGLRHPLYLDNDPFPGLSDTLLRLNTAKSYFDQYKNMPGVDMKLYDDRMKDVTKAIKRAEKMLKKGKGGSATPATPSTPGPATPKTKSGAKSGKP